MHPDDSSIPPSSPLDSKRVDNFNPSALNFHNSTVPSVEATRMRASSTPEEEGCTVTFAGAPPLDSASPSSVGSSSSSSSPTSGTAYALANPSALPVTTSMLPSSNVVPCTEVTSPPAPPSVAKIFPEVTLYTMAVLSCPPVTVYSTVPSLLFNEVMHSTPALALLLPKLTFFSFAPSANFDRRASLFAVSSLDRLSLAMDLRPLESFFHVLLMADNSAAGIFARVSSLSSSSVFAFLDGASDSSSTAVASSSRTRFCGSATESAAADADAASDLRPAPAAAEAAVSVARNSSNLPLASSRSLTTRATTRTAASF
mmetsp:Transcript_13666/g.24756  ORF Transcript_13666/g.24756 Transcript_13666/m.24756 type:complete len:315 (+) Transcript_13666:1569-2513(+)